MKKLLVALTLILVIISAPTAHADVAVASRGVNDCGSISWAYAGKPAMLDEWTQSLAQVSKVTGVQFVESDDANAADTTVKSGNLNGFGVGLTDFYSIDRVIYYSDITFATNLGKYVRKTFPHKQFSGWIRAVMMHEIGHALGLNHSHSDFDLMGPYLGVKKMSTDDITAFQSIRPVCMQ